MIALSHPTGNAFVRALLAKLSEKGRLGRFFTTLSARKAGRWPGKIQEELGRRAFDVPEGRVSTQPVRELVRLGAMRLHLDSLTRHETGWASVDRVYGALDAKVARWLRKHAAQEGVTGVYAYEDGAHESFRAARDLGLHRVYELPIAYWETTRRLLEEEAARLPEWARTLLAPHDSAEKTARKTEELEWAETVVCPSAFVADSLPQWARETKKVILAPFGSPLQTAVAARRGGGKLRVLFAGAMTQRKGLADLFQAMKLLPKEGIELVVMGSPLADMEFYRRQYPDFIYEPPRAQTAVFALMRTCDVLVLPSIVEGRALVQQEAMSCGLPLIVTANAGGEDLIEPGGTGWLVPIRSPEQIAAKLERLAADRGLLEAMSEQARRKAADYTWEAYASKIEAAIPA